MNGIQMVLSIFLYRFKTLFGRKANAFTLLALPCVILSCLWLFGRFYATDPVRIPVGVVDNDNSEFSKLVIARIKQDSSALELRECSISEAEVLVKNGALEAAVVFNKGFMEDLIALYPEGVTEFIYSPFSLARYLVQELFTSQISRLRFNCDAANRAVELRRMEAAATAVAEAGADAGASAGARSGAEAGADAGASAGARSGAEAGADAGANAGARSGAEAGVDAGANAGARSGAEAGGGAGAGANAEAEEANTRAGEANARAVEANTRADEAAIWDEAFKYADSYWSPEPLMTIDYRGIEGVVRNPGPGAAELLNTLILSAVFIIIAAYSLFCLLITPGAIIKEREDGLFSRLKCMPSGSLCWSISTVAVPAVIYSAPLFVFVLFLSRDFRFKVPLLQPVLSSPLLATFALIPTCLLISWAGYEFAIHSKGYSSFRTKVFAALAASLVVFLRFFVVSTF